MGDKTLRLHLIRHGKAAASAADYDQLRPLGETQARKLGEHLGARGQHFDAVYCGPHRRQVHTLMLCRKAAGETGQAWPQAATLEGLAEAPYEELLKFGLMERLPVDEALQTLVRRVQDAGEDRDALRTHMAATFDHMARLWHDDEFNREGMQTAREFLAQVDDALATLLRNHSEGDVAVVTSNGVIGTMVGRAGGQMPGEGPVLMIANGSVSVLRASAGALEVEVVSDTTHLKGEPGLISIL